jgi:putative ABC transport system permease protein
MRMLWQDLRFALQMLGKNRGFTAVALLTLALGIGGNTVIFSVVNSVLLQPLDYKNPNQLVDLEPQSEQRGIPSAGVSVPEFLEWKKQASAFQGMAALRFFLFTFTQDTGAMRVDGFEVSPELFTMLGEVPLMGRFFTEGDDRPGNDNILVVNEIFWRTQLGADPAIIGKTVRVDSRPFTVVGVTREAFHFPGYDPNNQMWKPLPLTNETLADWTDRESFVVARLKDGVSAGQAAAEMSAIESAIQKAHPDTNSGWTTAIKSLQSESTEDMEKPLYVLLAAVLFLLLIACLNIASLLTASMTARMKEVALRLALGASPGRLLKQFLTEGLALSLLGGLGGILLSWPALAALLTILPLQLTGGRPVRLSLPVFLFTLGLSLATGVFFGIVAALNTNRVQLFSVLKDVGAGTTSGRSKLQMQSALVVLQFALSLVLLTGAGLMIRSFLALRNTDPGFSAQGVLINTQLVLPRDKYSTNEQRVLFFKQLIERIQQFPDAEYVGAITALPLTQTSVFKGYQILGRSAASSAEERGAVWNVVAEDYFKAMGIRLIQGRELSVKDNQGAPGVALINDTLAKAQFPDVSPIGQRILLNESGSVPCEIVGVVASSRQFALQRDSAPEIFTPYQQSRVHYMYVLVKSRRDPMALVGPIRGAVKEIDPDQPVGQRTLEQEFANAIVTPRLNALVLSIFAALAVLIAGIGIYGVVSYLVGKRTREIGIRMALGASRGSVLRSVLGRGLRLAGLGVVIGLIASMLAARLLAKFLYRVGANDPATFAFVVVLLAAIAVLACWVPARRATKVDPLVALRYE